MAEEGGRFHNLESTNPVLPGIDFEDGLNYVIDVALRVNASRDRQAQEFVARGIAEH